MAAKNRAKTAQSAPKKPEGRLRQIVMNAETGEVLMGQEMADLPHDPASLNKIMTAYMAFEAVKSGKAKWTDDVTLSAHAAGQNPNAFKAPGLPDEQLPAGAKVNLRQMVEMMMLTSHNGFAAAIGEHLTAKRDKKGRALAGTGSESRFGKEMTETARSIGMTNTTFGNASGYNNVKNVSTARDLAQLSRVFMKKFPEAESVVNSRGTSALATLADGTKYKIPPQASIVRTGQMYQKGFNSFAAVGPQKTGTNPRTAGYNLATAVETQNGVRLIVITLGATSNEARYAATDKLVRAAVAKTHDPGAPEAFRVAFEKTTPSRDTLLALKATPPKVELAQEGPKNKFRDRAAKKPFSDQDPAALADRAPPQMPTPAAMPRVQPDGLGENDLGHEEIDLLPIHRISLETGEPAVPGTQFMLTNPEASTPVQSAEPDGYDRIQLPPNSRGRGRRIKM